VKIQNKSIRDKIFYIPEILPPFTKNQLPNPATNAAIWLVGPEMGLCFCGH
jgi:hypothetical protein